jgi:hypothetical protein
VPSLRSVGGPRDATRTWWETVHEPGYDRFAGELTLVQPRRRVEVERCGEPSRPARTGVRYHDWHSVPLSAKTQASTRPWGVQETAHEGCADVAQPSPVRSQATLRPVDAGAGLPARPVRQPYLTPVPDGSGIRTSGPGQVGHLPAGWASPCPHGRARPPGGTTAGRPPEVVRRPRGRIGPIAAGTPGSLSRWQRFSTEAQQRSWRFTIRGDAKTSGPEPVAWRGNERPPPESRESEWRDRPRARRKRVGPNTGGGARTREVHV